MREATSVAKYAKPEPERPLGPESIRTGVVYGHIQETGVVIVDGDNIYAIRHPDWLVDTIQTHGHEEVWLGASSERQGSRQTIEKAYYGFKAAGNGTEVVELTGGFGIGPETETVAIKEGKVSPVASVELTLGQVEEAHAVQTTPQQMIVTIARWVIQNPDMLMTSTVPVDRASAMRVNAHREDIGPYVQHIQQWLLKAIHREFDSRAFAVWDQVAQHEGYRDVESLYQDNGTLAPWFMNAGHLSLGLPHYQEEGRQWVPSELAIAVSDLVSSELGAPLMWLTASTPVIFGVMPTLNGRYLRDVRLEARHLLSTTHLDLDPLESHQTMVTKMVDNITKGKANTLGRSCYSHNGHAAMHSVVRVRLETKEEFLATASSGRVEAIGPGATPDLIAQRQTASYLRVLGAIATEAAYHQVPSRTYVSEVLGLASGIEKNNRQATADFNERKSTAQVTRILSDAISICHYVAQNFPGLYQEAMDAAAGLQAFSEPAAYDLWDFLEHRRGCFADAVTNHILNHQISPEILVEDLKVFQSTQAQMVLTGNI